MNENQEMLGRFCVAVFAVLAVAVGLSVQASNQSQSSMKSVWMSDHAAAMARAALERATPGAPEDWSHRHLIFSNPGSEEQALRNGRYDVWMHITNDPRFIIQQKKRSSKSKLLVDPGAGLIMGAGNSWRLPKPAPRRRFSFANRMHRDWAIGLGAGNPSPVSYPAKWSFDTTTASCANDFVVYPTGADGSSGQASVIAYFNLYSGCGGTVPSVDWAYNTGGSVTGAPSFSNDGSQIAFIQSTAGVASLVLLRIPQTPPGTGTLGTPITLTALSTTAYATCAAPCMTTIPLSGSPADTLSNPWIDYSSDTLFVGDDAGALHKFAPVFHGTTAIPAGEVSTSWPVTLTANLGSPVFDPGTGKVFVGTSGGIFYAVGGGTPGFPTIVSGQIYGTSNVLGSSAEEIVDAPIVDSAAGMAYVFVQADSDSDNAVFQFPTSFTSGSGIEAQVGASAGGTEFFLSGAFDNLYFNSESTCTSSCIPSGNLYVGGNTAGPATLYQIPITANVMDAVNTGPALETTSILPQIAGRTSPVTEFFNANGATATGSVGIESDPATWNVGGTRSVTIGTITYTFVVGAPGPSTATDVQVSLVNDNTEEVNEAETAGNLQAAISATTTNCEVTPCFGTGTVANPAVTASIAGFVVTVDLRATSGGAAGDFAISEVGSGINVGGGNNGDSLDFIFLSTYSGSGASPCFTGCVLSFDVTSGAAISAGTAPNAILGVTASDTDTANGFVTGGIVVDNELMSGSLVGTSQIYFLSLDNAANPCTTSGTGICATQASQAGLK